MILQTPIGEIEFAVTHGADELVSESEATFTLVPLKPVLPKGMAVEQASAILVELHPEADRRAVNVAFRWLGSPPGSGSPESGECLDAQSWEANGFIVVVGTEDFEALASRLPGLGFREDAYPVNYRPDGMEIRLPIVPADQLTSVHFVVAVNSIPEPIECSAWFAVDVAHSRLLAAISER